MYIAKILNDKGLFQSIGGWIKVNPNIHPSFVDEFLFRACSVRLSIMRMDFLNGKCLYQFRKQKNELTIHDSRLTFWSPSLIEFLNETTPFLANMRIMQNSVIPLAILMSGLKQSVDSSLADAIKKVESYGLTKKLSVAIKDYWENGGKQVVDYRDVDQHFSTVVKHAYIQIHSNKEELLVLIPDNPEVKSPKKFEFSTNRNALDYFRDSYFRLNKLVENMGKILGINPHSIDQPYDMNNVAIEDGVNKTLLLAIEDTTKFSGIEVGQTEERKIYIRNLPLK